MRCGAVIDPNFLNARGFTQMLRQTAIFAPALDAVEISDIKRLERKQPHVAADNVDGVRTS